MCHLSFLQVCSNGCVNHIGIVYFQKTFLGIKNFVPCTLKLLYTVYFNFVLWLVPPTGIVICIFQLLYGIIIWYYYLYISTLPCGLYHPLVLL